MTKNHDDHGDGAFVSGNDPLDSLLREWHAENAARAAAQREKLMNAVAKSRQRVQSQGHSAHGTLTPALSLKGEGAKARFPKGEGVKASGFARFTPALAASLAFAATLGLLFSTSGPQSHARADVIMAPNGGRLDAVNSRGELIGPCPLRHTDVHVDVSGSLARVTLQQRYGNPYADKIEAVYTFPLSHRAAVDRMTMTIGDRVVVGEVKEREAARATYEAAKSAGHAAALLEQERPNIFTQSVANIEPGVEIVVEISYVELLEARDGLFGFTFPMVVAPRYIPGGDDSAKPLLPDMVHREGLNLLAPGTLTITSNGDTSKNGVLTADVIHALITDAIPIETPPAEYWPRHYPTTGQPIAWHYFEVGYVDGLREPGVLYTDGLGQINGRWFYVNTSGQAWPPTAAAMPPGAQGTGFASGTSKVPDAARITPQPVMPSTRAGHDISITVNIDTGGPGITDLKSESHAVQQNWGAMRTDGSPSQVAVGLNDVATIPNKDFVLHWRQTADTITEQVFTHAGAHGGFITLILNPPARVENTDAVPRELVFVLDTSGSMQGFPIQKAKEVMTKAIAALRPQDTFNLITFAGDTTILWEAPQPATPDKLAEAQAYVESRQGRGGTEMMTAINAALEVRGQVPSGIQDVNGDIVKPVRIVCFLTDGEVGNDMAIIDAVKKNAATTRVFSFGIGNSVNRYLLDGIAKAGRGAAEYVLLSEGADEKVAAFTQRIQSPVLMNVKMEFAGDIEIVDGVSNGIDATDGIGNTSSPTEGGRYAMQLPDLYDVSPVIVHARYTRGGKGTVTLRGDAGSGPYEKTIELDLPEAKAEQDVIATLWAREKVEQIMNRDLAAAQNGTFPDELKKQVIDLGETFQIMTQYTSFVAVENLRVTIGGQPRLVPVPIELPEGQSWEGTMGEAVNKWADEIAPQDVVGRTVDMWSLVRANNTTPKQFNVPSQTDTPDPAQDTTAYYDFLTEVHLAYSYQYQADPNRPALGTGSDPTFPIMAEANPYLSKGVADVTAKLQQPLGQIDLDGVPMEQAIEHLRKLSGVNIVVNWDALGTAAIEKDKEVSLHVNAGTVSLETALKLITEEVGGGEVELGSQIGNGVVQISTKEDLAKRTTVQTYNVQDLIERVSEIEANSSLDPSVQQEVALEHQLLWEQTEKAYRVNEEKIKQAVIDYDFAQARELMGDSEKNLDANRQHAADATRYQQFRDHAVQLRRYIDDEEAAHDSAEISAASSEIANREKLRVAQIDETRRKQIESLMGHATELRKEGRYDDAATVLGQTLAIDPGNQEAATMKEALEGMPAIAGEQNLDAPESELVDIQRLGFGVAGARWQGFHGESPSVDASNERMRRQYDEVRQQLDRKGDEQLYFQGQPIRSNMEIPTPGYTLSKKGTDIFRVRSYESQTVTGFPSAAGELPAPQERGRVAYLGRALTTPPPAAKPGEAQVGLEAYRFGLADSLARGDATATVTRGQPPIAAAEGRTAGDDTHLRVGYTATPTTDPSAAHAETVLRELTSTANLAPRSSVTSGFIPKEPAAEYSTVDIHAEGDRTGGIGGEVADMNGDGLSNVPFSAPTLDGGDVNGDGVSDLGDIPALRFASPSDVGEKGLDMKPKQSLDTLASELAAGDPASTSTPANSDQIVYSVMNGTAEDLAETLEKFFRQDEETSRREARPSADSATLNQWAAAANHTNRAGQDVQFKDGHVDFEQSTANSPSSSVDSKPNTSGNRNERPRDKVAEQMLMDQFLVRTAVLARGGRLDVAQAVTHAILEAQPDQATAKAMHEVLSSGVLTPQSIAMRVCELAADAAHRLAASAERARLMAKRLDERLLRLAVGDASIRIPGASGRPAQAALADKPPVAPQTTAGLDVKDGSVLVSVLVDAFGDGTVAALAKSGLKIESTSKPTRVVIGRIAVKHLADLATCKHVRRVEAVKANPS